MKVKLVSVLVKNQQQALRFYTEKLGFVKKTEIPMGNHSWLTVVSADEPDGVEVVLEPCVLDGSDGDGDGEIGRL